MNKSMSNADRERRKEYRKNCYFKRKWLLISQVEELENNCINR